jgi:sigma-B regulation protein RsbU (phosphoserine phosphatase)
MWNRIRLPLLATVVFVFCLAAAFALFNDTNPLGGVHVGVGPDALLTRAEQEADSLGLDRSGLIPHVDMSPRKDVLNAVYARFGLARGNEILRTRVAGYQWRVAWGRSRDSMIVAANREASQSASSSNGQASGDYMQMTFDLEGRLMGFDAHIPDSIPMPSLSSDSARLVANAFLARSMPRLGPLAGISFKEEKRLEIPRSGRIDYTYDWQGIDSLLGYPVTVSIRISGRHAVALNVTDNAATTSAGKGVSTYFELGTVILIIALGIAMVVVGIRRIRVYEIGWRTGIVIGFVGAVLFGLFMYFSMPQGLDIRMAISLLIAPLFIGGVIALSWVVAESVGREVWKEKFVSLDLVTRGHLLDSRVAATVLLGLAGGSVASLVWGGMAWLLERITLLACNPDSIQIHEFLPRPAPALSLLAHQAYAGIFVLSVLVLFPLAIARRRIASPWVLVAVGSFLLVVPDKPAFTPYLLGLLVEWVSGAVVVWVLYKRDVLSAFIALVTAAALSVMPVFLGSPDAAVLLSGQMVVLLCGIVLIASWVGVLTKDRVTDVEAITPAFARHISERERLQEELKIARDVQMSLLPKATPRVPGLDIAARCVPAQEVGGDYYDFVRLDGGRLGVVIGDVSGKGTEGAFYMTLTKGFLKAVVRATESPAVILTQANELFCENVERGNFISMVYASLDAQGASVTFARAGHNPVILYRARLSAAEFFQPKGIALGLEPGEVFAKTIEEVSVSLELGDVLILYTDGFGEAMNSKGEEYGEERLQVSIVRLAGRSAEGILNGVLADVRSFVGKAEQHDDMTMVVVKRG